ncbi:MAG: NAD(P)-dependent oxidoreductase [Acidobacteria bacterium]|nr:NAD(P)-dependent oxidoreductase [Acidobacteriota bacterium]
MTIAVTGATGFLGRHVVAELERRSISPILICLPSKDLPAAFARHTIVEMDLKAIPAQLSPLLNQTDTLIHLAWGGLPNYQSLHHFEDELPAHYQFLKALIGAGFKNVVVAGTCFEYGMQSGPLSEGMDARPTNPYGFAKDALRRQLEYLQQVQPFKLSWARIFYLYGEGQSENSLLPQLRRAVERGDRLFKMSGGEQLRDYLPVADVVSALVELAANQCDNGVVNICSGKPTSVRKLVEGWIKENDWQMELQLGYYPYPEYEPMAFWGKRDKLDRCLTR